MGKTAKIVLMTAGGLATAVSAFAASDTPGNAISLDQNVDAAALARYHHTDQGTRLLPAAWLAAVAKPDGSGKVMNSDDLRRFGFLVDNVTSGPANPYGWPLGFTVSDPAQSGGVAIAGITCAACHTGQIEYKGTAMVIEGGQPMIELFPFFDSLGAAFAATATDPAMRAAFISDAIAAGYPAERMEQDFDAAVASFSHLRSSTPGAKVTMLPGGAGRVDAVQGIANRAFGTDLMMPGNQRDATAPVSYPYLWDIWRLSWLQYNAMTPSQPDSRNIAEVLGTEARTNIVDAKDVLNPEPLRWQTSIQLPNLMWMESVLRTLQAPSWPSEILGPIDPAKADAGRQLFASHCANCHGIKELPDGRWDVTVVPLDEIGTDPNQATNFAGYTYDLTRIGFSQQTPAYLGLSAAVNAIRKQLYADYGTPAAEQEPDLLLEAPCGYKARPLIGVWATPPFLHNGSVRTIHDLLSETRPAQFRFGAREYDPVALGYTEDPSPRDMILDTSVPANLNTGHWLTNDTSRSGRIGPKLSEPEKYAIIEYLKAATYEDYPRAKVDREAALPCGGEQDWALERQPDQEHLTKPPLVR